MGVAILLNNFFHDLSVALFSCALLGIGTLWRAGVASEPGARGVVLALDRLGRRIAWASLAGIVAFGAVRTAAFMDYEWIPAAGRGLVPALAVKHVVLASLLGFALLYARGARRRGLAAMGMETAP